MNIRSRRMVSQEVVTAVRCDSCKREVDFETAEREWHHFAADSGYPDGTDWLDVCSPSCFAKVIHQQVERMGWFRSDRSEVADMPLPFARALVAALATPEVLHT